MSKGGHGESIVHRQTGLELWAGFYKQIPVHFKVELDEVSPPSQQYGLVFEFGSTKIPCAAMCNLQFAITSMKCFMAITCFCTVLSAYCSSAVRRLWLTFLLFRGPCMRRGARLCWSQLMNSIQPFFPSRWFNSPPTSSRHHFFQTSVDLLSSMCFFYCYYVVHLSPKLLWIVSKTILRRFLMSKSPRGKSQSRIQPVTAISTSLEIQCGKSIFRMTVYA